MNEIEVKDLVSKLSCEYPKEEQQKANFEQIDYLSEESAIFIYDAEDNLDRSQVGDNITHFEYSANGYRYFKKENSDMPEYYVYDPNGRLQAIAALVQLSMTDGSSTYAMYPVTQYIWGPDRVLAKIDKLTNKSYYYLYNGHGDVVQIVDTLGAIKNTYDYDVWGNFLKREETVENHFTYFGQTYDETTGLYYLRARYYDPTTGRFTQQDSAEDGYNWYIYGNQNPVMYVDYTGEGAEGILSGAWGLGAGAASLDGPFPYGDVAGLVIGIVGSAIAGGVAIYEAATSGSNDKSKDDSKDKDSRLTGEPGEIKEERKSKTKIGSDGRAVKERHYSDHGNPSKHTNPHDHDITWDANGNPQFGPPINYPNGAPTFK